MAKTARQELDKELECFKIGVDTVPISYMQRLLRTYIEKEKQQLIDFAYSQLGHVLVVKEEIVYNRLPEELYKEKFED